MVVMVFPKVFPGGAKCPPGHARSRQVSARSRQVTPGVRQVTPGGSADRIRYAPSVVVNLAINAGRASTFLGRRIKGDELLPS